MIRGRVLSRLFLSRLAFLGFAVVVEIYATLALQVSVAISGLRSGVLMWVLSTLAWVMINWIQLAGLRRIHAHTYLR